MVAKKGRGRRRNDRYYDRVLEAQDRNREYEQLSTEEKYERAVERGHRDTKEAAKLREQLEKEQKAA